MARIVVPGGTGYLGRALTRRLVARGDDVVVLTRGPSREAEGWRAVAWDAQTLGPWVDALEGADAIVHLNGRSVDTRATRRNIDELISSRVLPVHAVGQAIARCDRPPSVWVQSGSLALFGDTGDAIIDESSRPTASGPPEMVSVCRAWEAAYAEAAESVERSVLLRIGIGLGGRDDRATLRLARIVGWGLGGRVGSGKQWVSWIALDDLLDILVRAIDEPSMSGLYHATSPSPVTNADMMTAFRSAMGKRFGLPTPAVVARMGAPILGTSASLALTGRRCVPTRLMSEGVGFRYRDFEQTVRLALQESEARPQ